MKRIADIIYLITKPFIFFELIIFIISSIYRPIFLKNLSKTLIYDPITKKVNMDIPPYVLVKYWFSGKYKDTMMRELEKTFFMGLIKLKNVYGTNKIFKTDVNSVFFRLMERNAINLNIPFEYEIKKELSIRQITERLFLISPFHFWFYIVSSILGNKKSRNKLNNIFKKVTVYRLSFNFK